MWTEEGSVLCLNFTRSLLEYFVSYTQWNWLLQVSNKFSKSGADACRVYFNGVWV